MANLKKKAIIQTKYGAHEVILEKDERGYAVWATNLPGVVTWGKTIKHAKEMAKEAIELCIKCLVEEELGSFSHKKQSKKTVAVGV